VTSHANRCGCAERVGEVGFAAVHSVLQAVEELHAGWG